MVEAMYLETSRTHEVTFRTLRVVVPAVPYCHGWTPDCQFPNIEATTAAEAILRSFVHNLDRKTISEGS